MAAGKFVLPRGIFKVSDIRAVFVMRNLEVIVHEG